MDVLKQAQQVLKIEAAAIQRAAERLGAEFEQAVELLFGCRGKVVVSGSGKSGQIGRKIASTLASTGTPALFLHPADGGHGDLGVVVRGDAALFISNSGESDEMIRLLPGFKKIGVPIILLSGAADSTLAGVADVVLDISVEQEACPNDLAPTASTTVTLALGDALAIVLLKKRGFGKEDFALLHPGGAIGRRLLTTVDDVMHSGEANAVIGHRAPMKEALIEITAKGLGAVNIIDDDGQLVGLITDGDLRRALERFGGALLDKHAAEVMTANPVAIERGRLAVEAVHLMEDRPSQISVLPVLENRCPLGLIRLHDLVLAGVT